MVVTHRHIFRLHSCRRNARLLGVLLVDDGRQAGHGRRNEGTAAWRRRIQIRGGSARIYGREPAESGAGEISERSSWRGVAGVFLRVSPVAIVFGSSLVSSTLHIFLSCWTARAWRICRMEPNAFTKNLCRLTMRCGEQRRAVAVAIDAARGRRVELGSLHHLAPIYAR